MQRSASVIRAVFRLRTTPCMGRSYRISRPLSVCPNKALALNVDSRRTRTDVRKHRFPGDVPLVIRRTYSSDLPPHIVVDLPNLSPTMEMGTLVTWEKKEGDRIGEGDVMAQIETDKATVSMESTEEGYMAKILVAEGTKDIPLGVPICVVVENESDIAAFKDFQVSDSPPEASTASPDSATPTAAASSSEPVKPAPAKPSSSYPNHIRVVLPSLSPTMETGSLVKYRKQVGEKVNEGDVLAEVETDKATMEMESGEEGFLAKWLIAEDTKNIPLQTLLCILVESESDIAAFKDYVEEAVSPTTSPSAAPPPPPPPSAQPPPPPPTPTSHTPAPVPTPRRQEGGRIFASPYARKLSREQGIDLSLIQGTGPSGRIRSVDLKSYDPGAAVAVPAALSIEERAAMVTLSKQTIPHYYLTVDIPLDNLQDLCNSLNEMVKGEGYEITLNDFIIKAASQACLRVPEVNSAWMDTAIRQFHHVDTNLLLHDGSGNSIISPVVKATDTKGLSRICQEVEELSKKALEGQLTAQESQGGTLTICNMESFGLRNFCPVIQPPNACALGVGGVYDGLVADKNSDSGFRGVPMVNVTLSCDHRVVDGAVGAQWLQYFKQFLEKPQTMIL